MRDTPLTMLIVAEVWLVFIYIVDKVSMYIIYYDCHSLLFFIQWAFVDVVVFCIKQN